MKMKKSRVAWCTALIVLAVALVYFNLPNSSLSTAAPDIAPTVDPLTQYASNAPLGYQVGQQLPDFTINQTDGQEFSLRQYRGKVVILNLWATWCTPCIKELPHFDRLQEKFPDDIKVLAIHSDLITDDPVAFLSNFNYQMAFAVDEGGQIISSLGGSTMLPQTVVLNPRGEVAYNRVGSVTYEALEELAQAAKEAE